MIERKKGNFSKMFSNKGSYILLILALALIFSSVYVNNTRKRINELNKDAASYDLPAFDTEEKEVSQTQKTEPKNVEKQQDSVVNAAEESAETKTKEPQKFISPLQGEMLAGYSGDTLVYNRTLDDWRVHCGIDIAGNVGDRVLAAADGVVESAQKDEMLGYTVIIKHSNDLYTTYANLQESDIVKPGQTVKQGDVIGGVGTTAMIEIADAPHLHFAVTKNGKDVNPFDYMEN